MNIWEISCYDRRDDISLMLLLSVTTLHYIMDF